MKIIVQYLIKNGGKLAMSKIFQLVSSVQLGGAEIVAFDLAEHCGKFLRGISEIIIVELYNTRSEYAYSKKKELTSKNIRVITLHNGSKRMSLLLAPFFLLKLIKKEKPMIIHSHTDLPDFVLATTIRLSYFFKIKLPRVVRTIHNTQLWRSHSRMGKITETMFGNESIVSVSSYAMVSYEKLREKYNLPVSSNRHIIYNGSAVPKQCPHPFKIEQDKINIAFCGRFEDYKGVEIIISTIPEIENLFPNRFQFHLIGDGSYKKQLQKLVNDNINVCIYDPVPNLSSMFYAFNYLWMPSHFEGLGLISIESSLSGVPVIAAHAPGLDETLPEKWPLKFDLRKKEELLNIFENITNNTYELKSLKEKAYNFVFNKFSHYRMINSYSELYSKLL